MSALELSNISINIADKIIVDNISCSIQAGEIFAIIGPNGAGKTTLLKSIVGDVRAHHGEVTLHNILMEDWARQDLARHLAILPQFSLLNFPYLVEDVVTLGRSPHRSGIAVDRDIVQQAMAALDITHLANRVYTELSGGEKQRTQLARVMTQIWRAEDADPRVLLLDEPATALDVGHQQQLMSAVKMFSNQGVAVVMVVHDINIAAKYANNALALLDGKALAQGPVGEVLQTDILSALYGVDMHVLTHPTAEHPVIVV